MQRPEAPWHDDRYVHREFLGHGSFGDVYLAMDRVRGHEVALKLLRRWDAEALMQLKKEFRALKSVDHPNLVTLYELHADDRDGFITMEVIRGVTIVDYVQAAPELERRKRIKACLVQLVSAVTALHASGSLHRDLKPSNVIVAGDGRLVVLDAGLAKSIDTQRASGSYVCGTPAYMSPEQSLGEALTEATDWYSVGVIAYELFTGHLPFDAQSLGFLVAKVNSSPKPIAESCPDLPLTDARIVDAMLARQPSQRPQPEVILDWLADEGTHPVSKVRSTPAKAPASFVGRTAELKTLEQAFAEAREHGLAVVTVAGHSGMGKTSLVRTWIQRSASPLHVAFFGRCYQRETVLFGGLEEIFEAIADRLQDPAVQEVLRPEELFAVATILGPRLRLTALAPTLRESIRGVALPPEPLEQRRLLGAAFARLTALVAGERTAILWVDDFQWGGWESAMLLADITHAHFAGGCLLIVSHRPLDPGDGPCLPTLLDAVTVTHSINLGPLAEVDAFALIESSPAASWLTQEQRQRLALDAAGHPLLIEQVTRVVGGSFSAGSDLQSVFAARLRSLPIDALRTLQVLSVAAEPLSEAVALAAVGLEIGSGATRDLLGADLVRRVGRLGHYLVPFHDRLREVIVSTLAANEVRALNLAIADALEQSGQQQPESLVGYYLAAGERARAARYVSAAATQMMQALAFDRAAKLFRISLDLADELEIDETQRVRLLLADALVNSGRVEEGARVRLAVASRTDGRGDQLWGQAARELVRAGRVDEGLGHARKTFERLGVRLSASGVRALPGIALDRAKIRARGLKYQLRRLNTLDPLSRERIDWCQSLGMVLPVFDTLRAYEVHNQSLLWSLKAGEPSRLGQAIAMEAAFSMALAGGRDEDGRIANLLETAQTLAEASGDPRALGIVDIVRGNTRWSTGDWTGCVECVERGVETLRQHCTDISWEVNFGQTHALDALAWMGQLRKKRHVLEDELLQAKSRGDLYAETMYRVRDLPTIHLVDDDVEAARRCADVLDDWPNSGFQVEHLASLYKQTEVDLYSGEGVRAAERLDARWSQLMRAQLMRLQPFRIELNALRGRALLAAAKKHGRGRRRDAHLRAAGAIAATIDGEKPSVRGTVFGAPVAAGVAYATGDTARAYERLVVGIAAAKMSGMRLHEQAMRLVLGTLFPEKAGEDVAPAEAWMRAEGISRPVAYARMLCAGL